MRGKGASCSALCGQFGAKNIDCQLWVKCEILQHLYDVQQTKMSERVYNRTHTHTPNTPAHTHTHELHIVLILLFVLMFLRVTASRRKFRHLDAPAFIFATNIQVLIVGKIYAESTVSYKLYMKSIV